MAGGVRRKCVLTADGHEPFEHVSSTTAFGNEAALDKSAAEFCAQVWMLGNPERKAAKNISITVEVLDD